MFACVYAPSCEQATLLALASSFSPLVEDTTPVAMTLLMMSRREILLDSVVEQPGSANSWSAIGAPLKKGFPWVYSPG